jgi:hypothetical protein
MLRAMEESSGIRGRGERDGSEQRDGGAAALHLAGLVIACAVAFALFPRGTGDDARDGTRTRPMESPPAAATTVSTPFASAAGTQAAAPSAGTAVAEDDAGFPAREPLAGLVGAWERFGGAFTIRQPSYADPRRRAQGYGDLLSWYFTPDEGAVLVLVQGRGVGVWPLTAPDDRAGRLRLADGTDVIWVVGHPLRVTGARDGAPTWAGTEITLGVAVGGNEGWYLRSDTLPLAELLRIAESLRPYDGG